MANRTCSIDGCERRVLARGWCHAHYQQWYRTGSPTGTARPSASERFWRKVQRGAPDACWLWTGAKNGSGYGVFHYGNRMVPAHRWAYEAERGSVDGNLDIDHLCRNPSCVNPAHLEPVTHAENMARGHYGSLTHCAHGHAFTEDNIYRRPGAPTERRCRACMQRRNRELVERRKADRREACPPDRDTRR